MDNVFDLDHFRNKKSVIQKYFSSDKQVESAETLLLKQIFVDLVASITEEWKQHAVDNSLNKFVIDHFRDRLIEKNVDYTNDLNAVSRLEHHIHLYPIILGPGSTTGNSLGWGAGFYLNGLLFATPEFSSEAYARCFNILLFAKLKAARRAVKS